MVKKRILLCVRSFDSCNGADRSVHAVLNKLLQHSGVVLDLLETNPGLRTVETSGTYFRFPLPSRRCSYMDLNYIRNEFRSIKEDWCYTRTLRTLNRNKYDLLISNEFAADGLLHDGKLHRKMMVLHGSPLMYEGKYTGRCNKDAVTNFVSKIDVPVTVSKKTASQWDQSGLLGESCRVIPNCIDELPCAAVASSERVALREGNGVTGEPVIVCLASVQYRKGQDVLLKAWTSIKEQFRNATLLFVGPSVKDSWWAAFTQSLQKAGLDTHWVGAVSNPLEYLRMADVSILPSRDEALPLSILEAMLLKTPVVASDVAGIPEMVMDGETGLLFEPGNSEQLATQVIRILSDEALQKSCIENALEHYQHNYSRELFDERWNLLLDELL